MQLRCADIPDVCFMCTQCYISYSVIKLHSLYDFVCVEVLRPSQPAHVERGQPNGVMSSTVSLPHHMFTGQA